MRCAALTAITLSSVAFAQTGAIDQTSPRTGPHSTTFNAGANWLIWQQQIRPTANGQLEGIRISHFCDVAVDFRVALRHGPANSTNPILFEAVVHHVGTNTTEEIFLDMRSANYTQTAGQPFVMEVAGFGNGNTNVPWIMGNYIDPASGSPLYPEPLFLNGSEFVPGWKLGFDTFVVGGCDADYNSDTVVDFFDYLDFVADFANNAPAADFNHDGTIDFFDYLDFVQAFSAGC